jgi:hypothetical protein
MIFDCKNFEEFKEKLDAVETLGLDYDVEKKTTLTPNIGILRSSTTWTIVAKGVEVVQP